MSLSHKFLARSVVFFLLLGLIPAVQLPAVSAQDTATYNLTKYDCTPGYDPGTADANSAFANCATPASGVSFTLTSGDDSYAGGTQQTDGGGSTSWSGIPLGSGYSISESIPPGYGVPWVYCEVSGDPNNPSDVQQSFFQAPGGTMDVGYTNPSLTSYTQASCSWFNVPPANGTADLQTEGGENQPPGTTTVTIHKQVCGYRYDAQGKTLAQLQADCPGTTTGVGFTIGGESSTLQFTDQNGEVVLNGVALGSVRIQEELFAGVDAVRVFCQAHPTGDTSVSYSDTDELPLEDGSNDTWAVTVQATEGNKIDCLWFNSILTESDYSTVIVHKYECPNGYDPDSEALDDLIANCTAPIANPSFDLINVNVQLTVAGDATGTVAALNIQPGSYSLHQTLPEGYLAVRILCHPDEVGAQQAELAAYIEYSFTDPNQVDIDVEAGYELTCYWFDVPKSNPPDSGTVTVYKYNCPDDFDWENGEIDYLRSGCTEPGSGIDFQLRTASYQSPQNTDNSGLAAWSDAPEGTLTLFEDVPDGYKVGRFFCGVSSDSGTEPSSWDEYTYDGGVDVERPFGQYLSCYIFDVPSGFGTVYVYKYECAPDFDWQNGTYDYLASGCTTAQEDVTFEVSAQTPGNYSEEQTTDSSGVASWTDVPEGGVSILEQEPEGYALGRVFCGVTEQNSASLPSSWDEYDHTPEVDAEVPAGQYLHCTFFDITGNYGSIVITKYLCHGGSAELGSEADYDTYTSQCTEPGDGYDFTVSTSAGDLPGQTGVDGTVSWSALEPGDVTVSESLPSGYDSFAVYCTTDPSSGDYQQYVGEQVYSFDYTAEEGVTLYCSWFDYAPDTGTTITIYKYTCEHFFVRGWPTRVDYEEHCTAPQSGVDFTLYAGMAVIDTATSDAAGVATLDVSQSGQYQIVESPIEGYLTAAVFCTTSSTDDPAQAETLPVTIDVTVDYPVTCFWYNGEDLFGGTTSDPGTVVIHKYECPPGYPESGTNGFEDILGACTLPANNVAFSVSQGGSEVTSGSTGDAGEVALTGAATGATRVSEFPIEGWDPPRVFCAIVPVGIGRVLASYDEQTVTTWGIDFDFPADSYIDCYWFDRPPSNGTEGQPIQIIIHKILCAPDTLPGDVFEGAITECDQKEEGVDFALVGGDGGSVSGPTDVNGYAEYNGLAPGNVTITETLRDGYKTGAVFCSAYTSTQGDYELFPVTDESISYYLAGGIQAGVLLVQYPGASNRHGLHLQVPL